MGDDFFLLERLKNIGKRVLVIFMNSFVESLLFIEELILFYLEDMS